MNIIIPIGGKGERFKAEGFKNPKPLIKVIGREMILRVIDCLKIQEGDDLYIFYSKELEEYNFREIVEKEFPFVKFSLIMNPTRGAAETLLLGLNDVVNLEKRCLVLDCDTFYKTDILSLYRNIDNGAIFYFHSSDPSPIFSYTQIENGIANDIIEKVKISNNANCGIYCFQSCRELLRWCSTIVENNLQFRGEFYTSRVIKEMIDAGFEFRCIELQPSEIIFVGTPSQLRDYLRS